MMTEKIAVYGGGGFAREVAWLIQSCNRDRKIYEVVCFIDDDVRLQGQIVNRIPVFSFQQAIRDFPGIGVVGAIGNPQTRQTVMEKAVNAGFRMTTIIHPNVDYSEWVDIGPGSVICAGSILTTNIRLGKQVQINLDCTIGHDVIMGDYTTLAPGVHVSGWVYFGKRVYVGTGAVIINGIEGKPLIIDDDAIVGAGACVTKSVLSGVTVVGIPAKPLHHN
jgi:sugar O-acyltransferase (sialic acid O-acetyltransferase NeuD family)